MNRWLKVLIVGLLFLGMSACSNGADSSVVESKLKTMIEDVVSQYDVAGATIAVKHIDGSVFKYSTGFANKESGELLNTAHDFRIGSVSKTFTAKAMLLLYQDGLCDLDDSVESLLPDLEEFLPMHGKGISVRMLLNHTSGLEDYITLPYEESYFFYVLVDNPLREYLPQELVEISVNNGLISVPGESFNYSNTNYILLGLIIEQLSAQSYETFVQERLLDPLELKHTSVPLTTGFTHKYAHGYFEKDSDGILYDYSKQSPTAVWSAGNIISTVSDLLLWLESFIDGELLTSQIKDEQFDFEVYDGFGYGLGVASIENALGHNGTVLGYQIQMFEYKGAYFVIYTNSYYLSKDNVSQVIFDRAKEILFPN